MNGGAVVNAGAAAGWLLWAKMWLPVGSIRGQQEVKELRHVQQAQPGTNSAASTIANPTRH
jgi:hypothetical protein